MLLGAGTKEAANLVGREVGNHLTPLFKVVVQLLEAVALKHAAHHLLVHDLRQTDAPLLHYGGPMLIADGVAQLKEGAKLLGVGQLLQLFKLDNEHATRLYADNECFAPLGIEVQNIPIAQPYIALQSDGHTLAPLALGHKAASLGTPCIELQVVGLQCGQALGPGVVVAVANYPTNNRPCHQLNQ